MVKPVTDRSVSVEDHSAMGFFTDRVLGRRDMGVSIYGFSQVN